MSDTTYGPDANGNYGPLSSLDAPQMLETTTNDRYVPISMRASPNGDTYVLFTTATGRISIWRWSANYTGIGGMWNITKWKYAANLLTGGPNGGYLGPTYFTDGDAGTPPDVHNKFSEPDFSGNQYPAFARSAKAMIIGTDGFPRVIVNYDNRRMQMWRIVPPAVGYDSANKYLPDPSPTDYNVASYDGLPPY